MDYSRLQDAKDIIRAYVQNIAAALYALFRLPLRGKKMPEEKHEDEDPEGATPQEPPAKVEKRPEEVKVEPPAEPEEPDRD